MEFLNAYEDVKRAESYAKLELTGTYYLAYRDLPEIILEHVTGRKAFDFGCGTGRSSRLLQEKGFNTVGVDISENMIKKAVESDPEGDYRLISDGDFSAFEENAYDLVSAVFTFDNIPDKEKRINLLKLLRSLLNSTGKMVLLDSTPELYTNEWASFSTRDFPENRYAKSGDRVKIIMTQVEDKRPVDDILWFDKDYQEIFKKAGLQLIKTYKPLAKGDEPYKWINETRIAPWVIYVLKPKFEGHPEGY